MSSNLKRALPNLFTLGNMFFGFLAVVYTSAGDFIPAAWFIILAALCDAFDGVMARLVNASSQFGVEFDSIADVVSFGLAPAFLLYKTHLHTLGFAGLLISAVFLFAGGFRLARFNVQLVGFSKKTFSGLPIPSAAMTVSSFVIAFYGYWGFDGIPEKLVIPLTLGLGLLMVSKIPYDTLPAVSARGVKEKPYHFIFLLAALAAATITSGEAMIYVFAIIVLSGIVRKLLSAAGITKKLRPQQQV